MTRKRDKAVLQRELTVAQLEEVWRNVENEEPLAAVVEFASFNSPGFMLGIVADDAPGTPFGVESRRNEFGDGSLSFDGQGYTYLEGFAFHREMMESPETVNTIRAFALGKGFKSVIPIEPDENLGEAFHFWMGRVEPAPRPATAMQALEHYWLEFCALGLQRHAQAEDLKIANVIVYFGGDDPGEIELLYVNSRGAETEEAMLASLKTLTLDYGSECHLGIDLNLADSAIKTEPAAIRFAHRLAARLEAHPLVQSVAVPGCYVVPLFHDRESRLNRKLLAEARERR